MEKKKQTRLSSKERGELLLIRQMLKNHPEIKNVVQNVLESPKQEDVITPYVTEILKKERMVGVQIGWTSAFSRCYEEVQKMDNREDIVAFIEKEANKLRKELGITEMVATVS